MEIIKAKDINSKSVDKQLEFYKTEFESRHCSMWGWEVHNSWVLYDGELYHEEAFEKKLEFDRIKLQSEIDKMNKQIADKIVNLERITGQKEY